VDDEAGRLVDHEDRLVGVHDVELDRLRRELDGGLDKGLEMHDLPARDHVLRSQHAAVHVHAAGLDPVFRRVREKSGNSWASAWSKRWPRFASGIRASRGQASGQHTLYSRALHFPVNPP